MIPVVKAKLLEGKKGLIVGIANEGLFRSVRFDQHLVCDGSSGKGDGEK